MREQKFETPDIARLVRRTAARDRMPWERPVDQAARLIHPDWHPGIQSGCVTAGSTRERRIVVCMVAVRFLSRDGHAQAGMLMTRGALIDLLARHPLSDTAAMGKRQTSCKQLLGLTRAKGTVY
jgi:hypothetical protein